MSVIEAVIRLKRNSKRYNGRSDDFKLIIDALKQLERIQNALLDGQVLVMRDNQIYGCRINNDQFKNSFSIKVKREGKE